MSGSANEEAKPTSFFGGFCTTSPMNSSSPALAFPPSNNIPSFGSSLPSFQMPSFSSPSSSSTTSLPTFPSGALSFQQFINNTRQLTPTVVTLKAGDPVYMLPNPGFQILGIKGEPRCIQYKKCKTEADYEFVECICPNGLSSLEIYYDNGKIDKFESAGFDVSPQLEVQFAVINF